MPNSDFISGYLSQNPNNSMFFYITYLYSRVLNLFVTNPSNWFYWQIFNLLILDVGFLLLFKASKQIFSEQVSYAVLYLCLFSLSLSPWILVPYTDTFAFSLISLIFYVFGKMKKCSGKLIRIFLLVVLGLLLGVAFLLKPSSIIFFIALIILEFVQVITSRKSQRSNVIKKIMFVVLFFLATITAFSIFQKNQNFIKLDNNKSKPAIHFIMMGLKNEGGYNQEDSDIVNGIDGHENKEAYIKNEIRVRLKNFGFFGYMKFLMKKHFNNTSNGDFGWGRDGTPQRPEKESTSKFQFILRDWYYQQGNRTNNIRFFMHLMWLITLLFSFSVVFIKLRDNEYSNLIYILMLSVLGAFMYLLIFEGGRSRYLIQFLPIFYILAGVGICETLGALKPRNIKQ